ncbi:MAG: hypothetical protein HZB70_03005 [Candidatus Berkelbacteria bacterium]|nr:MAG: hypothetical protein HZB70_03005 [Candidatus Berkelbacteria bacterium]QQG51727.1 MAG: hypothetical protein HY845_04185 [Candidatus Berkelbacteria bacterium]
MAEDEVSPDIDPVDEADTELPVEPTPEDVGVDETGEPSLVDDARALKGSYQDLQAAGKAVKAARAGEALGDAGAVGKVAPGGVTGLLLMKKARKGSWMRGVQARIRLGRVKVAAAKKAALTSARGTAAKMAARRGAVGLLGRAGTALLAEAAIPVIGWIMAAATALWLLFKTKLGRWILIGLLVLISLPGFFFAISFGLIGSSHTPSTPQEKNEVQLAGAFAGDVLETKQVTDRLITSELNRYEAIKDNLKEYSTGAPSDAAGQADAIITDLTALKKSSTGKKNKEAVQKIVAKKRAFEATLPFNEWAARAAEELLRLPPGTCPIAPRADTNLGCASFVSYVLIKAGIPQSHVAATVGVWTNPNLTLVVPNLRTINTNYYNETKGSLKRGDIIWWGYGVCGKKKRQAPGGLHCHIGIFVGNDEAIHNSSTKANKAGGIAPIRNKVTHRKDFNGAKRYAPQP